MFQMHHDGCEAQCFLRAADTRHGRHYRAPKCGQPATTTTFSKLLQAVMSKPLKLQFEAGKNVHALMRFYSNFRDHAYSVYS